MGISVYYTIGPQAYWCQYQRFECSAYILRKWFIESFFVFFSGDKRGAVVLYSNSTTTLDKLKRQKSQN